jgi:hypothetical protein
MNQRNAWLTHVQILNKHEVPQHVRKPKYRNVRTYEGGYHFDSKLEAAYFHHLKTLQSRGVVKYFLRQVPIHLAGGEGKPLTMRIDFVVHYSNGVVAYQDVKGIPTRDWLNKKKMAESLYPIEIEIVKKGDFPS